MKNPIKKPSQKAISKSIPDVNFKFISYQKTSKLYVVMN